MYRTFWVTHILVRRLKTSMKAVVGVRLAVSAGLRTRAPGSRARKQVSPPGWGRAGEATRASGASWGRARGPTLPFVASVARSPHRHTPTSQDSHWVIIIHAPVAPFSVKSRKLLSFLFLSPELTCEKEYSKVLFSFFRGGAG